MKTIWKYELAGPEKPVAMPKGAQILTAQMQGDRFCVWALVDPDAPKVNRSFRIYMTGQDIDINEQEDGYLKYIQTLQMSGLGPKGVFVVHIFELLPTLVDEVLKELERGE